MIIGPIKWISNWHQQCATTRRQPTKPRLGRIVSISCLPMTPTVTLETKCWEHDWRHILEGEWLRLLAERNAYPFSEKILMINNVRNYSVVSKHAERAIQQGWITKYVIVEEHAAEALDFFSISRESLGDRLSLFHCRTGGHFPVPLRFPFALRRRLHAGRRQRLGVPLGASLMSQDPRIKICNLHPGEDHGGEKHGLVDETDDFYIGCGFSDQCYLVRTEDFRQRIYNESHPASARYPRYGGELFEKRIDSWLRNHGHLRSHIQARPLHP